MNEALIVIDFQNDFVFDALGSPEAEAAIYPIVKKIEAYKGNDVYYTLDLHPENYGNSVEMEAIPPHCIVNTKGAAVVPRVRHALNEVGAEEVRKDTFCFTHWEQILNNYYDVIEICGVATDICVLNNALYLRSLCPKTRIVVNSKCCAGTTPENHQKALDIMEANCIEVIYQSYLFFPFSYII